MTPTEALARNYRAALVGAVSRRSEATLHRGYELGREAVADGVSVLELARMHHECLRRAGRRTAPAEDVPAVAVAASEFFLEILATMDMAQRAYLEGGARSGGPGRQTGEGSRPGLGTAAAAYAAGGQFCVMSMSPSGVVQTVSRLAAGVHGPSEHGHRADLHAADVRRDLQPPLRR